MALQTTFDRLRADPEHADGERLMPEIVRGLATTASLHPPSWQDIAEWAGEIADFMRKGAPTGLAE